MSVSLNSPSESTSKKRKVEELADLTQNHDEALDLQLGLGALGGIRHSAACEAAEISQRRYDDRNHRLHEARMRALGLEGEEKEPEADDMSHQVLIRSPIIHNHYGEKPSGDAQPQPSTVAPPTTAQPTVASPAAAAVPTWMKVAAAAALLGGGALGGAGVASLLVDRSSPAFVDTDTDTLSGIGLMPPGPPARKEKP